MVGSVWLRGRRSELAPSIGDQVDLDKDGGYGFQMGSLAELT